MTSHNLFIINIFNTISLKEIFNMKNITCILNHIYRENIIVLQGYDHKHLKYLDGEAKFTALGKHALYHRWYHSRIMLVLSVFGRKEEIEDIFDGLCYWQ